MLFFMFCMGHVCRFTLIGWVGEHLGEHLNELPILFIEGQKLIERGLQISVFIGEYKKQQKN